MNRIPHIDIHLSPNNMIYIFTIISIDIKLHDELLAITITRYLIYIFISLIVLLLTITHP